MTSRDLSLECGIAPAEGWRIACRRFHYFARTGDHHLPKKEIHILRPLFLAAKIPARPALATPLFPVLEPEEDAPMGEIVAVESKAPQGAELLALAVLEANKMIAERDAALAAAKPKLESFDALMRSERTMSITEASKYFGLHPKLEVFPYLRERGYLTRDDLPTQAAIDAGYLALRKSNNGDGRVFSQAVVLDRQLETWRLRIIPQVRRFLEAAV
jgi:phage antirepressor YoqD-like protein